MYRVAFKIGLVVAVVAGGVGWLAAYTGASPWLHGAGMALASGLTAYVVAAHLLGYRLNHVAAVLDKLFEQVGRTAVDSDVQGDEVDRLVRRSDQALHAVQKHVSKLNHDDKYRREFVGDVSHEIKTPVFAIHGFAETLLSGALEDRSVSRSFVEKILNHANRLTALARDLSDISRLETGAMKLSMEPFDAGGMLEEVCESLEIAAEKKDIDVRIEVGEGAGCIQGDRERICQVMTNLLDNAIKYTNCSGWVKVCAAPAAKGAVRLSVQDNGIGIDEEDIDRVTERFYRTEKSRSRNQGGTGLGLSIVKHILAAHGTSLRIESDIGRGSTFSFTLPAGDASSV